MKNINKKNNNGITLIALVITIIVLLILAGVAISMLSGENGILKQAAKAKTETEKQSTLEQIKLAAMSAMTNTEHKIKSERDLLTALQQQGLDVTAGNVTGDVDTGYKVTVNGETYNVTTSGSIEKAITFSKTGDLAIGSEVTASNGEKFYVIGFSADNTKVNLLAKYNLKADGSKQDTTGANNECAFSSTNYWSSVSGITYPDANGKYPDLNDEETYQIPSDGTSIVTTAKAYGTSLGVTGRLMTYEEAYELTSYSTILYGNYEEGKCLNYWLGSAYGDYDMWIVDGDGSGLGTDGSGNDCDHGVRPVIEVLTSSIK